MEKTLTVKYQKIIGNPVSLPGTFYGMDIFERTDAKSRTHRGKLFALLSIAGPKNFDAATASKIIFDLLEEEYFRETEGSPLSALERATVSAGHRFVDLALGGNAASGSSEFNLVLAVSWGQVLYLSKIGPGVVYLLREGTLKEISMGDEAQVSTASGLVSAGDVLILGTPGFKEAFPLERLNSVLSSIEEAITKLPEKTSICALILKFDIQEAPAKDEVIRFAQPRNLPKSSLAFSLSFLIRSWALLSSRLRSFFTVPVDQIFLKKRLPSVRSPKKIGFKAVFLVVLLLFIGSVIVTLRKQNQRSLDLESQKLLTEVQTNISSAQDLLDLNNSRAKILLEVALENLNRIERFSLRSDSLSHLREQANKLLSAVTKDKTISAKLLYDFSLQNKVSSISSLAISPSESSSTRRLFATDNRSNNVFEISFKDETVSIEKIDQGLIKAPTFLAFSVDTVLGLDEEGVFSITLKDQDVQTGLLPAAKLSGVFAFQTYLGNLYFLMPKQNKILKSPILEEGKYGPLQSWLKEDRDLSQVSALAIDGSIYLLENTGRVLKFEAGKILDFNLTGFDGVLSNSASIFTDSETSLIYMADPAVSKILVFSKEGVYQRQYSLSGESQFPLNQLPIFAVDGLAKKVYFLSGSKLFQFDLD